MPRPKKPWFRLYVEMVHDKKLTRLTPAQRWLWVVVLASARESPVAGFLMLAERVALTTADLANASGLKLREVEQAMTIMEDLEMIQLDKSLPAWFVPSFWDRQFEGDIRSHH